MASLLWVKTLRGMAEQALALLGEFNAWEPKLEHWAVKNDFGVWNLFLPDAQDGTPVIAHRCVLQEGIAPPVSTCLVIRTPLLICCIALHTCDPGHHICPSLLAYTDMHFWPY